MTAPISNGPTTHGYTTMRDATVLAIGVWGCAQVVDSLFMRQLSRLIGVVRIRWGFCTTRSLLAACRRCVGHSCSAIPPIGGDEVAVLIVVAANV